MLSVSSDILFSGLISMCSVGFGSDLICIVLGRLVGPLSVNRERGLWLLPPVCVGVCGVGGVGVVMCNQFVGAIFRPWDTLLFLLQNGLTLSAVQA